MWCVTSLHTVHTYDPRPCLLLFGHRHSEIISFAHWRGRLHLQRNAGNLTIKDYWCSVCSVALAQSPGGDGNLCHPIEQNGWRQTHKCHHRLVEKLQLSHQNVTRFGADRDLLHEMKVYLKEKEHSVKHSDKPLFLMSFSV